MRGGRGWGWGHLGGGGRDRLGLGQNSLLNCLPQGQVTWLPRLFLSALAFEASGALEPPALELCGKCHWEE